MPVKRRSSKRRLDPAAELAAWSDAFECEFDFFDALEAFGIVGNAAVKAALPDAWQRLGARFMETWQPNDVRSTPWALDAFGEPPHAR